MPTVPRIWTDENVIRLRELAETGITAANIASTLSFEWSEWLQNPLTEEAVRQQASRWNITVYGRSTGQIEANSDPFAKPSWMDRVIENEREKTAYFPRNPFVMSVNGVRKPEQTNELLVRDKWVEYLVKNGLVSRKEAESEPVRGWFTDAMSVYEMNVVFDEGVVDGATWRPDYANKGHSSPVELNRSEMDPENVLTPGPDGVNGADTGLVDDYDEGVDPSPEVVETPKFSEVDMLLPDEVEEDEEPDYEVVGSWSAQSRDKPAKAFRRG